MLNHRKAAILSLFVLTMTIGAGAVYYLSGRSYVLVFSESQLRDRLARQLPFTRTYLLIFQVTLDNPRVMLTEGTDRVHAGLDVALNIGIAGEANPLRGSVDVSGGVRYAPDRGELFLTDPVIERLAVDGVPERYTSKVSDALAWAVREYYASHPIYTLRTSDMKHAAARLLLKEVTVKDGNLVIEVGL